MAEDFDEAAFALAMENAGKENTEEQGEESPVVQEQHSEVVQEPVVETEPKEEAPVAETKTVEVIKEVEKIVEKLPEFKNEESKRLYELWLSGDEGKSAVRSYIRETEKDYATMSDIDVRREALKNEHPNWNKGDIELEIRHTYGQNLEKIDLSIIDKDVDPEEYADALQHNKEVDRNLGLLARDARDARYALIEKQKKIELPAIQKHEPPVTNSNQPTKEEIEEGNRQWAKNVDDNMPKFSNIKLSIDGKEVEYAFTDDDKKKIGEEMKSFNIFNSAKKWGWYNEDGTPNVLKIAEDVQLLENREKIVQSIATQIKTDATRQALKEIKNIDTTKRPSQQQPVSSLADAYYLAGQN